MVLRSSGFIAFLLLALTSLLWLPARVGAQAQEPVYGLTDRSVLAVHQGTLTVRVDGTLVENLEIRGSLRIRANNVTVRNVWVYTDSSWSILVERGSATFEHVEVGHPDVPGERGIGGDNVTARYLNIHHVEDGIKAGNNSVYERIWVHDLDSPNPDPHADALQDDGGVTNFVIRDSILDSTGPLGLGNAAILIKSDLGPIDGVLVERNYLNGGAYSVFVRDGGNGDPANVVFRDNAFGSDHQFGILDIPGEVTWEGNYLHESGEAVLVDGSLGRAPAGYEARPILTPHLPIPSGTTAPTTTVPVEPDEPSGGSVITMLVAVAGAVGVIGYMLGRATNRRRVE